MSLFALSNKISWPSTGYTAASAPICSSATTASHYTHRTTVLPSAPNHHPSPNPQHPNNSLTKILPISLPCDAPSSNTKSTHTLRPEQDPLQPTNPPINNRTPQNSNPPSTQVPPPQYTTTSKPALKRPQKRSTPPATATKGPPRQPTTYSPPSVPQPLRHTTDQKKEKQRPTNQHPEQTH